jgi:hypothetical protein
LCEQCFPYYGTEPTPGMETGRSSFRTWQDRIRDPMLTVLLALELSADFIAEPLAARGLPVARAVADTFRR